jgi:hypothetical protein
VTFDSRASTASPRGTANFFEFLPPHSVENVGDAEIHLISIEWK